MTLSRASAPEGSRPAAIEALAQAIVRAQKSFVDGTVPADLLLPTDVAEAVLSECSRLQAEYDDSRRAIEYAFVEGWNAAKAGRDCNDFESVATGGVRAALLDARARNIQDAASAEREVERRIALESEVSRLSAELEERTREASQAKPRIGGPESRGPLGLD